MPVFADVLPELGELGYDYPTTIYTANTMEPRMMWTYGIVWGILCIYGIVCFWKMLKKAWLPGWWSIIPFYNIYLYFKLAWRSGGWTRSILFPPLFLIMVIVSYFDIAKRFGKGVGFGFGLWFLWPIFYWILAFGKSVRTPREK
jgi:hypothetical protein